ncbi:LD-carboxypeptidase [Marinomonas sp. C2222]|uniref:LD-carboxypeptidase n=1 Tax=Marinomonas sargassi TaxID=2984494 RepID=A0ABT2YRH5_9GAMM|nr:S66 peptidase family protein [Marinomonas sargassi]MCV2402466.1 LD-carboxypeptidase [Marinomonas sargassi]
MLIPQKLKAGDEVRVVAPSRSLAIISQENRALANKRFTELGLTLSFSKHCEVIDEFASSSIEERVQDLHDAFLDKNVKAIFTVIGGHNVNQILQYLDYSIVKNNPKIFCGFSDTTALSNALFHKTGLVTYSGPSYSTLSMLKGLDHSLGYLKKALFSGERYAIENTNEWSDDAWYLDQESRVFYQDEGIKVLNEGAVEGTIIGGNLCTLNLLQGTDFMPSLVDTVLFLEDDELTFPENFDRDLQSLIHQRDFDKVKGLVIGRFQKKSQIAEALLIKILKSKKELEGLPILYDVSFGHTTPHVTFPIGGKVRIDTSQNNKIVILEH